MFFGQGKTTHLIDQDFLQRINMLNNSEEYSIKCGDTGQALKLKFNDDRAWVLFKDSVEIVLVNNESKLDDNGLKALEYKRGAANAVTIAQWNGNENSTQVPRNVPGMNNHKN